MPTESMSFTAPYPVGPAVYEKYYYFQDWERSPRDSSGKLALRANPWSLVVVNRNCTNGRQRLGPLVYPQFTSSPNDPKIARARAIAESDLRGELARRVKNKEVGALGVSIASTKQSIDMLRHSASELTQVFSAAERFYQTTKGKRRAARLRSLISRGSVPTAGMVLSGMFGWAPLFEDFASAAKTVANPWPSKSFFSVKKSWTGVSNTTIRTDPSEFYKWSSSWSASGHSTYACSVAVTNPNLWLGNKLGLINPFGVAWDLVPWSFLVNMVSNMGQVMGSLTDFAGLTLSNTSLTTRLVLIDSATTRYQDPRPEALSWASGTENTKVRGRVIGISPPEVTPYMRFPDWNLGTAAIAGSLLIQQVSRVSWAFGYRHQL